MDNYENDGWESTNSNTEPIIPQPVNELNEQNITQQPENEVNEQSMPQEVNNVIVQEVIPQETNYMDVKQDNMNVIQPSLPQDMYDIIGQQPLPQQPIANNEVTRDVAKHTNKKPIIIGGILLLIVVLIVILYLTGIIGTKTLICTQSDNSSIVKMNREMKLKFRQDAVYEIDATMTIDLGEYASEKDTYIKAFEELVEDFKADGVESSLTSDDSKIYINFKAKNNNFINFGIKEDAKYKNVKETLEKDGYTCK